MDKILTENYLNTLKNPKFMEEKKNKEVLQDPSNILINFSELNKEESEISSHSKEENPAKREIFRVEKNSELVETIIERPY